jgi:hypothetical protein
MGVGWLAAVRALGDGAALSHLQAAALWHLRSPHGGWIHVTVPKGGRAKRRGLIVHRTLVLPPQDVTVREAIPVTTPARTLADLAGMLDAPALARALEEAEKRKLLDVPSVLAVCAGRPGAAQIRDLLKTELPPPAASGRPRSIRCATATAATASGAPSSTASTTGCRASRTGRSRSARRGWRRSCDARHVLRVDLPHCAVPPRNGQ